MIYAQCKYLSQLLFISTSTEEPGTMIGGQLLKEHLTTSPPDMSPFFLRQYVKGHAGDVFEPYPQLLTEMVLRLPYQVHKYAESTVVQPAFEQVTVVPSLRALFFSLFFLACKRIRYKCLHLCSRGISISVST